MSTFEYNYTFGNLLSLTNFDNYILNSGIGNGYLFSNYTEDTNKLDVFYDRLLNTNEENTLGSLINNYTNSPFIQPSEDLGNDGETSNLTIGNLLSTDTIHITNTDNANSTDAPLLIDGGGLFAKDLYAKCNLFVDKDLQVTGNATVENLSVSTLFVDEIEGFAGDIEDDYYEDLTETITTSNQFISKVRNTTGTLSSGDYRIDLAYKMRNFRNNRSYETRFLLNGVEEHRIRGSNRRGTDRVIWSDCFKRTLNNGPQTTQLDFRYTGNSSSDEDISMDDVKIHIWKVSE